MDTKPKNTHKRSVKTGCLLASILMVIALGIIAGVLSTLAPDLLANPFGITHEYIGQEARKEISQIIGISESELSASNDKVHLLIDSYRNRAYLTLPVQQDELGDLLQNANGENWCFETPLETLSEVSITRDISIDWWHPLESTSFLAQTCGGFRLNSILVDNSDENQWMLYADIYLMNEEAGDAAKREIESLLKIGFPSSAQNFHIIWGDENHFSFRFMSFQIAQVDMIPLLNNIGRVNWCLTEDSLKANVESSLILDIGYDWWQPDLDKTHLAGNCGSQARQHVIVDTSDDNLWTVYLSVVDSL